MLTICPTPIGNLDDITPRQLKALGTADIIACEDTRTTGKLLELLGVVRVDGIPRLVSYHEHNERERTPMLIDFLREGKSVVLVSDAGTPGISDPGYHLVRAAAKDDIPTTALPGPVAAMVALSASGLPSNNFYFAGFPSSKRAARRQELTAATKLSTTSIFYESPHRIVDFIADVVDVLGTNRQVCIARELTKKYEEYIRGTAGDVLDDLQARERIRGEFVVIISPPTHDNAVYDTDAQIDAKIRELLSDGMRPRGIKEVVAQLYDIPKSQVYERIERIKSDS